MIPLQGIEEPPPDPIAWREKPASSPDPDPRLFFLTSDLLHRVTPKPSCLPTPCESLLAAAKNQVSQLLCLQPWHWLPRTAAAAAGRTLPPGQLVCGPGKHRMVLKYR